MAERRSGPREEAEVCYVSGCKDEAERSISAKKYQAALPDASLKGPVGRRVTLCRRHYKEFRKKTKEDRELERLGW